jgi:hypothetical protein
MVTCISFDGRLFSLNMAISVRRCRSVNTNRCFLGCSARSFCCSCSLRLQAVGGREQAGRRPGGGGEGTQGRTVTGVVEGEAARAVETQRYTEEMSRAGAA